MEYSNKKLKEIGYQLYDRYDLVDYLSYFKVDLEEYVHKLNLPHTDVFRTKLGDIKQIQNLHKHDSVKFNELNTIVCDMLGFKDYEIMNNQYFCKPSNYKMTSAHQDNAYFQTEDEVYTIWIPLQDVGFMNSCMYYVPESHLNGILEHKPIGTNVRTRTGVKGVSVYSDVYKNKEFEYVPMELGQIVVHDKDTMHLSSPNMTDDYRYAITIIVKVFNGE